MKFLLLIFGSLVTQEIHRTDIVYAEAFGTIQTEEPYSSNQYTHFHIFSPQEEFHASLLLRLGYHYETLKDDRSTIYEIPVREKRKLRVQ